MTTGTVTKDTFVTTPTDCGSTTRAGTLEYRNWSGTDYPKLQYTRQVVLEPRGFWKTCNVNGVRQAVWFDKPKVRTKFVRPPGRAMIEEHPYSMQALRRRDLKGQWRGSVGGPMKTGTYLGCFGGQSVTYPTWTANHDLVLLSKLRDKVAGSDFNLAVFLAEGNHALDMIFNAAKRVSKAWRFAQKGNFVKARRALVHGTSRQHVGKKSVASNWLELQYGWLPLLKDAEGGAQFLAHHLNTPLQTVVRASLKVKNKAVANWPGTTFLENDVYVQKSIKAIIREKDVAQLVGLTDPLSVVWEKLPYSFVVDWFIPIGNYLAARGLQSAISGTFVTTTKKWTHVSRPTYNGYYGPGYLFVFDYLFEQVEVDRVISSSISVPYPHVKPLGGVASWKRTANAVSLLLQHRN